MKELTESQKAYYAYLETDTWKAKRQLAIERDGGACRLCNSFLKLRVHHRHYPRVYGEEPLTDLITLCDACHSKFHKPAKPFTKTKKLTKKQKRQAKRKEELKELITSQKKDMRQNKIILRKAR